MYNLITLADYVKLTILSKLKQLIYVIAQLTIGKSCKLTERAEIFLPTGKQHQSKGPVHKETGGVDKRSSVNAGKNYKEIQQIKQEISKEIRKKEEIIEPYSCFRIYPFVPLSKFKYKFGINSSD